MKKKHAPIKQLRAAGEEARKKLIERGIITPESSVDRIKKDYPKLMLPGMPEYLPHKWTLKDSQRMMYDLLKMWQFQNKKAKKDNSENLCLFIEFAIKELQRHQSVAKRKMDMTPKLFKTMKDVPVLGKIFAPINQYETIQAMMKFYIDSFAVAIIVTGKATTTSEYAEWFLDWTQDMYNIWTKKNDKEV